MVYGNAPGVELGLEPWGGGGNPPPAPLQATPCWRDATVVMVHFSMTNMLCAFVFVNLNNNTKLFGWQVVRNHQSPPFCCFWDWGRPAGPVG